MRLPTLVCGILSWLIISREVVPRLGRLARTWRGPRWTGAALFLAFWMAFNNGLRPEPVIALGALLTWSLVERSIATRRLVPGVAAIGVAAFSLGAGPTGLMCVAALAAGAREFVRMVRRRAQVVGWAAILGPVLALLQRDADAGDGVGRVAGSGLRVASAHGPAPSHGGRPILRSRYPIPATRYPLRASALARTCPRTPGSA